MTKTTTKSTTKTPVKIIPTPTSIPAKTLPSPSPTGVTLTVAVLDAKNQPLVGATVSITPSDATATTDSSGEVQFKLGSSAKYEVTATAGGATVTVPYYVTANGATRLVVNPVYIKQVEAQRHQTKGISSTYLVLGGIVILIIVAYIIIRRFLMRR